MVLPNLPTDNLYKFLFIGGMTLTITAVILSRNLGGERLQKGEEINLSLKKLAIEYKLESEHIEDLGEISKMRRMKDSLSFNFDSTTIDRKNADSVKAFEHRLLTKFESFISKQEQHFQMLREPHKALALIDAEVESKNRFYLSNDKIYKNEMSILNFLFYLGWIITCLGVYLWNRKVQVPLDKRTALELKLLELEVKEKERPFKKDIF